jgi:hypothetical protein
MVPQLNTFTVHFANGVPFKNAELDQISGAIMPQYYWPWVNPNDAPQDFRSLLATNQLAVNQTYSLAGANGGGFNYNNFAVISNDGAWSNSLVFPQVMAWGQDGNNYVSVPRGYPGAVAPAWWPWRNSDVDMWVWRDFTGYMAGWGTNQSGSWYNPRTFNALVVDATINNKPSYIGGVVGGAANYNVVSATIPMIYGQGGFNTYCVSLNTTNTGYIGDDQQPAPNRHPYDNVTHSGNFTIDHHISFVTSIMGIVDKQLLGNSTKSSPCIHMINNTPESAMNFLQTPFGTSGKTQLEPGMTILPFLNKNNTNLFHPYYPIPCHQILRDAPGPGWGNPRTQSSFGVTLGTDFQTSIGVKDIGVTPLTNCTYLDGAHGAQAKFGTACWDKGWSMTPGYLPKFFNFPSLVSAERGVEWTGLYNVDGGNPNRGYISSCTIEQSNFSRNWLERYPEGYAIDGRITYTGRNAYLFLDSEEDRGNYTKPVEWVKTIYLKEGTPSVGEILYQINQALQTPDPKTGDFAVYRKYDFRNVATIMVATETDTESKDEVFPWSPKRMMIANSLGPAREIGGRLFHAFSGPNCIQWIGAQNLTFQLYNGQVGITNTVTSKPPAPLLQNSTLNQNLTSVYALPSCWSRTGADAPLYGSLDQQSTPGQQVALDPQALAKCVSLAAVLPYQASVAASAYLTQSGAYDFNIQTNTFGTVTSSTGLDLTSIEATITFANGLSNSNPNYPLIDNVSHTKYVQYYQEASLSAAALGRINQGIYLNPLGDAQVPGLTGITLLSLCDGSAVENAFWETLGFDPQQLKEMFTPDVRYVEPVEGEYYCCAPGYAGESGKYHHAAAMYCVSNQTPHLNVGLSKSAFRARDPTMSEAQFMASLPTLPTVINEPWAATGTEGKVQYPAIYSKTNCALALTVPSTINVTTTLDASYISPANVDAALMLAAPNGGNARFISYCQLAGVDQVDRNSALVVPLLVGTDKGVGTAANIALSFLDTILCNPYNMHQSIPRQQTLGQLQQTYELRSLMPTWNGTNWFISSGAWGTPNPPAITWPMSGNLNSFPTQIPDAVISGLAPPGMWCPLNGLSTNAAFGTGPYTYCPVDIWNYWRPIMGSTLSFPAPLNTAIYLNSVQHLNPASPPDEYQATVVLLTQRAALRALGSENLTAAEGCALVDPYRAWIGNSSVYRLLDQLMMAIPYKDSAFVDAPFSLNSWSNPQYTLYIQTISDRVAWDDSANQWLDALLEDASGAYVPKASFGRVIYSNGVDAPTNYGMQVPKAGRVVCDSIAPYYFNSTPLQYDRGASSLLTLSELEAMAAGKNGKQWHKQLDMITKFQQSPAPGVVAAARKGRESRMLGVIINDAGIQSEYYLGYPFGTQSGALSNTLNVAGVGTEQYFPTFNPTGNVTLDPSDPIQSSVTATIPLVSPGTITTLDLNQSGMFLIGIKGLNSSYQMAVNSYINGSPEQFVFPVAVVTAAAGLNTLAFNTTASFPVAAQTISRLLFTFTDLNGEPINNLANCRVILTFTPTGQPTPGEQAFITGQTAQDVAASTMMSVSYGGPNAIVASEAGYQAKRARLGESSLQNLYEGLSGYDVGITSKYVTAQVYPPDSV